MTMHQLSLEAHAAIHPYLEGMRLTVFNEIQRLGTACNHQVAEELGMTPNMTSGRFTELKDAGLIEEVYRDTYGATNRRHAYYQTTL